MQSALLNITAMNVYPEAIPVGTQAILAHMTVECGPLLITGAGLSRRSDGEMRVWFPSCSRERRVILRGQEEREAVLQAALKVYRALSGRDPADTPVAKAIRKKDSFRESA